MDEIVYESNCRYMKEVTPETFYLRKLLWEIQENVGIEYLIDLHGHSKKYNFIYLEWMLSSFVTSSGTNIQVNTSLSSCQG